MCNVLKYRKILKNVTLRLRCGCVYFFNLLKTSRATVSIFSMNHPNLRISGYSHLQNIAPISLSDRNSIHNIQESELR